MNQTDQNSQPSLGTNGNDDGSNGQTTTGDANTDD